VDNQNALQVQDTDKLAVRSNIAADVQQFEFQQRAARLFAMSGLFADIKGQSPEQSIAQAFVKISLGESMGFNPAESMTGIDIIQGRVAISANMRASRMQRAGYDWDIVQLDDKGCSLKLKYRGEYILCEEVDGKTGEIRKVPVVITFGETEAARAGLIGKDNYKKNPRNMFFARAITNAQRWYAPGILSINILSAEEVESVIRREPSEQSGIAETEESIAEMKKIDEMFAELGTKGPKITSIKANHIGRNDVLIEWLEGQVAKKRNDGSKHSAKDATAEQVADHKEPEQKSTHRESAEPDPQQDAKQSSPVGQEKAAETKKSAPPVSDSFNNW
jgi:hypothetical protein